MPSPALRQAEKDHCEELPCCTRVCDEDQISVSDGDTLTFKHRRRKYYLLYLGILLAVAATAYWDRTTTKVSLDCIKHPRESESTYHAHEDVDCTLRNNTDVYNFEFADVLIRTRSAKHERGAGHAPRALKGLLRSRSAYGVFLLGSPRRKKELYLYRWYLAIEEAVRDAGKLGSFLNKTKHEAGLIRLRMAHDARHMFDRIYFVQILCLAAFWLIPVKLMTTFDAKLDVFVQEQRNIYGVILKRLSFPLERVSFCNVEAYDSVSVWPQAGSMMLKKQKEYSLNVRTFKGEKFDLRMGKLLLTASKGKNISTNTMDLFVTCGCIAKRKLSMIQSFLNKINGIRENVTTASEGFDEGKV